MRYGDTRSRVAASISLQPLHGDAQRSCRSGSVLKRLDFQRRMIGHDSVEFNKLRSFRMGNVKNRLHRFAPSIRKAAVKSDMKNIVKCKVERLKFGEVGKAIERLTRPALVPQQIYKNFVYRSFVQNPARLPNKEMQIFIESHSWQTFHFSTATCLAYGDELEVTRRLLFK
jgi:hypothetical protein